MLLPGGQPSVTRGQNLPGNLFYRCHISVQTLVNRLLADMDPGEVPLLLQMCLLLLRGFHTSLLLLSSCQVTHLPAMCSSVWDLKVIYPTFRQENELRAAVSPPPTPNSSFLPQKHKHPSKRRVFSCLVCSSNSPGWTPRCVYNLHFDWCTAVFGWRVKDDPMANDTEWLLRSTCLITENNGNGTNGK